MPQTLIVPFTGHEIGQGFNSETREKVGTALSVPQVSSDKFADGQIVTTSFKIVTDQGSLMESLGMSASIDARYMLFSAGGKVDFTESHSVNTFSSFIAGRMQVANSQIHGHDFTLNAHAEPLVTAQRMADFKTAFGDMFVRAINTGGEFCVIARITSVSEESQRSLTASLHAGYNSLAVQADFSAQFNKAMTETNNHTEVTVWTFQAGGQGDQASFTGLEAASVLTRLKEFPSSVLSHPVGYEAELAAYNTIPIPIPTDEEIEDRERVLEDCANQKREFLKAISDVELALSPEGSTLFEGLPDKETLANMSNAYRTALNGLMRHAIKLSRGEMNPPQEFVATPAPPAINFKLKKKSFPSGFRAAVIWPTNNRLYVFKGMQYYRYTIDGDEGIDPGYPQLIGDHWPHLAEAFLVGVDAAVVWPNGKAYFFKGDQYARYTIAPNERVDPGYPQPIAKNWPGLAEAFPNGVDAVFVHGSKAYFFKERQYVQYNIGPAPEGVDPGYPKPIAGSWPGLAEIFPDGIDAAVLWPDDKVYFFKGDQYVRYSMDRDPKGVDPGYPQQISGKIM